MQTLRQLIPYTKLKLGRERAPSVAPEVADCVCVGWVPSSGLTEESKSDKPDKVWSCMLRATVDGVSTDWVSRGDWPLPSPAERRFPALALTLSVMIRIVLREDNQWSLLTSLRKLFECAWAKSRKLTRLKHENKRISMTRTEIRELLGESNTSREKLEHARGDEECNVNLCLGSTILSSKRDDRLWCYKSWQSCTHPQPLWLSDKSSTNSCDANDHTSDKIMQ